jgi:1A family penicillin-binding protein
MRKRLLIGAIAVMTLGGWYAAYQVVRFSLTVASELSRANDLTGIGPRAQTTIVLDRQGHPAFAFYAEQRIDVTLDKVSRHMVDAIVAVEDRRFFSHYGLDPFRIVGAAVRNVRAGGIREGGSTITQQLARAMRLSPARTFERKVREAMLALRLEQRYSKERILQEYLNTVYFGDGYYGVEAAARGYFGKNASALTPPEAALLAAVVRAPSRDVPSVSPERALRRRNLVLRLMRSQSRISDAELSAGLAEPLANRTNGEGATLRASGGGGEYFQEEVRQQLVAVLGQERMRQGGFRVYSTYEPALQRAAEQAIRNRVAEIARNRRRAQDLQGSLVAIDPASGDVLALVGGRNFSESPYNRATQARRQPGSAFKPIIYAAALERGYAPGSMLHDLDTPIGGYGAEWLPGGEHEDSEYTLRTALQVSSNRAAAQLLQHVGITAAVDYAHRFGITSRLPSVPSLALGTGEVTLLELTAAYGVFANEGMLAAPRFISRIEDANGLTVWSSPVDSRRAVSSTTAFLMSSMLADVVSGGTASSARGAGFTRPAGGKTGTTDNYADAWFIGYTPHLVAGVWFGLDTPAPIMNRGFAGVVAVPAWARFMKAATTNDKPDWYAVPADVEKVTVCRLSGARATDACRHAHRIDMEPSPSELGVNSMWPLAVPPLPVARSDRATSGSDSNVYEDFFPLGAISSELCPLHNSPGDTLTSIQGEATAVIPASYRQRPIVVERAIRSDGSTAISLRGGGQ